MNDGMRPNSSDAPDAGAAARTSMRSHHHEPTPPPVLRRAVNAVRSIVTIAAVAGLIVALLTIDLLLAGAHRPAPQPQPLSMADAESTSKDVVAGVGDDGIANLAIARHMARNHRVPESKAYFHRAIYGRWGADSAVRRRQARLELIELLAANGGGRDLLAELLPFEDVAPDSIALRRRLGQWFLLAGSPARATRMFREVLRRDPRDALSYAGMGEAALALGDFATARTHFIKASAIEPRDATLARRLALADSLVALDPMARGLGVAERRARGVALVERTLLALDACAPRDSVALADSARVILAGEAAVDVDASNDERLLNMASGLWSAYGSACTSGVEDEALRLLYERLAS
jgi:tetratricopeptide (TPR) repeat protein